MSASLVWFEKRKGMGSARPITWQGWVIYFGFVFTLVILAQFIGRWVFAGFAPLAFGIWLIAGVLALTGGYMAAVRRFSKPTSPTEIGA